jgi:hypothetical protein
VDSVIAGVFIGIGPENIDLVGENDALAYIVGCNSGTVYGPNYKSSKYFTRGAGEAEGSIFSVRLDLDKRTMRFGLNGKWSDKIAFSNLHANEPWFPFIGINQLGSVVTLVRD